MKFALHFGNNTFSDPEGARRSFLIILSAMADSQKLCQVVGDIFQSDGRAICEGGKLPAR